MSGNTSGTGGYLIPVSPIPPLPPLDDGLSDIMHNLIAGVTGLPPSLVRPRRQAQPPTRPAATVNWAAVGVTQTDPLSDWTYTKHNNDGTSTMQRHIMFTVLLSFYGPDSNGYAGLVQDGLLINQNLETLATTGIKVRNVGMYNGFAELINTQWIGRTDLTIVFVRQIDRTYSILNVDSATIPYVTDQNSTDSIVVNQTPAVAIYGVSHYGDGSKYA